MKVYRNFFLLTLAVLFLFSSCQKESLDDVGVIVDSDPEVENVVDPNPLLIQGLSSSTGYELSCFSVDYPFSLLDADEVTHQVNNEDELNTVLDSSDCVEFVYPLNITHSDGTTNTITDYYDLIGAYASCAPEAGCSCDYAFLLNSDDHCHELIFPVDLVDEDGNSTTVNDEQEFAIAVAEESILSFSFPLTVEHVSGNTRVLDNEDELGIAQAGCSEDVMSFLSILQTEAVLRADCIDITYPISVALLSGTNLDINNNDEFMTLDLSVVEKVELPVEVTIFATGTTENIYDSITLLELTSQYCQ